MRKQIRENKCDIPTKWRDEDKISGFRFHMPFNVTSMVHQFIRMHELASPFFDDQMEENKLKPSCRVQDILCKEKLFQDYKDTKSYKEYYEGTLGKKYRVNIFYIDSLSHQGTDIMEYEVREMVIVEKEEDVNKCAKALFEAETVSGSLVNDSQQIHQRPIANFCNHTFIVEDTNRPVTQWHSITPPQSGRPYNRFIYYNFMRDINF